MRITRRVVLATVSAAGAGAALAAGQEPDLPRELIPGQHPLKIAEGDRDGLYYIPTEYKSDLAMPLWVVLHGAGGTAQGTQYMFPLADEFGAILVAPDSRDE